MIFKAPLPLPLPLPSRRSAAALPPLSRSGEGVCRGWLQARGCCGLRSFLSCRRYRVLQPRNLLVFKLPRQKKAPFLVLRLKPYKQPLPRNKKGNQSQISTLAIHMKRQDVPHLITLTPDGGPPPLCFPSRETVDSL